MPEPIMDPATSMVESSKPKPRTRPVVLSVAATALSAMMLPPEHKESSQHAAQEKLRPWRLRLVDDLAGRPLFDDLAVGQNDDPIGHASGEADFMSHHNQCHTVAFQVFQYLQDFM